MNKLNGWVKRSDRYYRGHFAGLSVRLLCPDMESVPEQHNKWYLMGDLMENRMQIGELGDDISVLWSAAEKVVVAQLMRVQKAIASNWTTIVPDDQDD